MKHPLFQILAGILGITIVLDILERGHTHGAYWWHSFPGFEFLFGLAGAALLTFVCKKFLAHLIGRKENYYERRAGKP